MLSKILNSKKTSYILMTLWVFLLGLEYIAAKATLEAFKPMTLIFVKYSLGVILVFVLKLIVDRRFPIKKKDIVWIALCALFGEVLYFACEYGAMEFLPVSVITIILAFVPVISILTELVIYKSKPTGLMILGVLVCIVGVAFVMSADFSDLLSGKYWGYLLAFGAVISWNIYNFGTKKLTNDYKPLDLTFYQILCSMLLAAPYAIFNMPDPSTLTTEVIAGALYVGFCSAFIGFLIFIKAIEVLGPTPCSLYSNFVPVTTTLFGWLLLGEVITGMQMFGGVLVIASGVLVIWQKSKMEKRDEERLKEPAASKQVETK